MPNVAAPRVAELRAPSPVPRSSSSLKYPPDLRSSFELPLRSNCSTMKSGPPRLINRVIYYSSSSIFAWFFASDLSFKSPEQLAIFWAYAAARPMNPAANFWNLLEKTLKGLPEPPAVAPESLRNSIKLPLGLSYRWWVNIWACKFDFWLNRLWQPLKLHKKGFSPVWIRKWVLRLKSKENFFPHSSHW